MRIYLCWLMLMAVAVTAGSALAAVDLVTLPTREGTQLTIYNSEDITMVREHRLLTVKEGVNRIQFSWANTLIDPTSDRVPHPGPAGQGGPGRYDLPGGPQRRPAMEHQEPDGGQDPGRDPLLHQRHHLGGRLRGHRQRGRDEAQPDRLRAGVQQLGRALRQRPDAAGGGQRSTWWRRSPTWPGGRRPAGLPPHGGRRGAGSGCGQQCRPKGDGLRYRDLGCGRRRRPATAEEPKESSSRASPNTSSSPSKAARTSRTRSPSGWWP